jgi:hypothetical protein
MADEQSGNPKNDSNEGFASPEAKFSDISHNMAILMSSLESKFGTFGEFDNSNSYVGSNRKLEDK